jgi:hypothetical protein
MFKLSDEMAHDLIATLNAEDDLTEFVKIADHLDNIGCFDASNEIDMLISEAAKKKNKPGRTLLEWMRHLKKEKAPKKVMDKFRATFEGALEHAKTKKKLKQNKAEEYAMRAAIDDLPKKFIKEPTKFHGPEKTGPIKADLNIDLSKKANRKEYLLKLSAITFKDWLDNIIDNENVEKYETPDTLTLVIHKDKTPIIDPEELMPEEEKKEEEGDEWISEDKANDIFKTKDGRLVRVDRHQLNYLANINQVPGKPGYRKINPKTKIMTLHRVFGDDVWKELKGDGQYFYFERVGKIFEMPEVEEKGKKSDPSTAVTVKM